MVELKLLGTPQILRNGQPITTLSAAKSQALLFYLAVTGRPHSRLALAELFWPEKSEADALANLRQALYHLRNALPDALEMNRLTVALNPALPCQVDAVLFEQEVGEANPLVVRQRAVERYTGEFLAGFSVEEAAPFTEWTVVTRERLHRLATAALHQIVATFVLQRDRALGLSYANRWLALEPWREEAQHAKLQLLAWQEEGQAAPAQRERQQDWGQAPDIAIFYGRQAELTQLAQWIVAERSRVVTILGMGGMGKTALAARLAHTIADHFDFVIWRSLLNAPPLVELLRSLIPFLSRQQITQVPATLDEQLALLLRLLRQQRCLLVLDNAESIMQSAHDLGARAGYYRAGYEAYGQLFKRLGESQHQSCLLLTSREQPHDMTRLERSSSLIRTLPLRGVTGGTGQAILQAQGVIGTDAANEQLIQRYSGNPLALLLIAETIQTLYEGDLAAFLTEDAPIFDDIRDVLQQQFARLTAAEQEILFWLAIEREPVTVEQLSANLVQPPPRHLLLEALTSLRRRSLLEKSAALPTTAGENTNSAGGFTLQNVLIEYLTEVLIERVCGEIEAMAPVLLKSHALLKAQAMEYIRQSQVRLLVQPLGKRLQAKIGLSRLTSRLQQLLDELRRQPDRLQSYGGGNIFNCLLHWGADLGQVDFSYLAHLPALNLAHSDLTGSLFTGTFGTVISLAFSPDGAVIAAGLATGQIRLWRTADGQPCGLLEGHTNYVWSVLFSPDGQTLYSCSEDYTIRLWDLRGSFERGVVLHTVRSHTKSVWRLSLTADGRLLASAGADGLLCLWQVNPQSSSPTDFAHLRHTLRGHTAGIRGVAFSPDGGLVASASEDHTVGLWDVQRGVMMARLTDHTGELMAVAFSGDGQWLASGGRDHAVRLWHLPTLISPAPLAQPTAAGAVQVLTGHPQPITFLAFSPDSTLLASSSYDPTIRLWAVRTGEDPHAAGQAHSYLTLQAHVATVNAVVFSPDGKQLASGGEDQTVRLWEPTRGQLIRTLRGHLQRVIAVAFAPDGARVAAACQDHKVRVWHLPSKTMIGVLHGHNQDVKGVAFSPDSETIASCSSDQTIHLWNVRTGQSRAILRGHTALVRWVVFSPDGTVLASTSSDSTVRLWDARSGELLQILPYRGSVWTVAFSPDGQTLAYGGTARTICLWHRQSNEQTLLLQGHDHWVTSLAFTSDGRRLVSGSGDGTARVWNLQTGEAIHTLRQHRSWVYGVAIAPHDTLLASASNDQTVCLWALDSGQLRHVLHGHTDEVISVAFDPRPSALPLLCSGSSDETLKLWDAERGICLETLRAPGPYEDMNITGATGITEAQKAALKALGAVDHASALSLAAVSTRHSIHRLA